MSDGDDPVIGGREPPPDHESFEGARAAGFPALRRSLESRRRAMSAPVGAAGGEPNLTRQFSQALQSVEELYRANTGPGEHRAELYRRCAKLVDAFQAALRSAPPGSQT
jgi:hypothetical protein